MKGAYRDTEQLDTEHRILSRCLANCPGVPNILEVGDKDSGVFVLVEEPYGTALNAYVRESSDITCTLLRCWAEKLTRVVKEVHSRGVVHRDIKPSNIIMSGKEPRLIDFGCAVDVVHSELLPAFSGTAQYASDAALAEGEPCFDDDFASLCYTLYSIEVGLDHFNDMCGNENRPSLPILRETSEIVRYLHILWERPK